MTNIPFLAYKEEEPSGFEGKKRALNDRTPAWREETTRGRIATMSASSSPKIPSYRTTLFFGPEAHETKPDVVYCVFNVKKRSWKGGIQLVVEIEQPHASRCNRILELETWLRNMLRHLPQADYDEYFQRGQELFLQYLCQEKLQLAIEGGLRQETTLLSHDVFSRELEEAIRQNGQALKETLLAELDVPPTGEDRP